MQAQKIFENIEFKRKEDTQKSLRIGKYAPQKFKVRSYGDEYTIEVIHDTFYIHDLEVRLEFKTNKEREFADVYTDGEKDDMLVFKISPADYEFKEQGEYSEPGYTGYGYPIAKDKEDLKRLKEYYSSWYVSYMDYSREHKNPFVAVAQMILLTH